MAPTAPVAFTELYFAYGANMDADELTRRVGPVEPVGIAHLADHRLVFNRHGGTLWDGGVSSVILSPGESVFGVVWRMSPEALAVLDRIESPDAYQRLTKEVVVTDGRRLACHIYVSYPQMEMAPAAAYLALLISAAEKANLPATHIAMLKAHRAPDEATS